MSTTVNTAAPVDPIAAAIATAQAAAAAAAKNALAHLEQTAVANAPPLANALPANYTAQLPAPRLTMNDMVGGLAVSSWLGVNEHGFSVGAEKKLHVGEIEVVIDLAMIQPMFVIKYGNPVTYYKTYDRVLEASGGSWAAAVERAQRNDPKAREYRSAEIPMLAQHDIAGVVKAGDLLGHSLSTTNWANWESFYADCTRKGLVGQCVRAKLSALRRAKPGYTWGVISFELVGPANPPLPATA